MSRWKNVFIRKAFKSGNSLAVRIPKELADAAGIKEGDVVDWQQVGDRKWAIVKVNEK